MSGYLLDTSALSAYYYEEHPHHAQVVSIIDGLEVDAILLVSAITLAEIEYGIGLAEFLGSTRTPELRKRAEKIKRHAKLAVTHHTSAVYAELKLKLAKRHMRPGKSKKKMPRFLEDWVDHGTGKALQLDENDLWICAQAKERDLTAVTADADFRVFEAVDPEIKILLAIS